VLHHLRPLTSAGSSSSACVRPPAQAADYVTAELSKTNKAKRLKGFEAVRGVILEPHPFSVSVVCILPSEHLRAIEEMRHACASLQVAGRSDMSQQIALVRADLTCRDFVLLHAHLACGSGAVYGARGQLLCGMTL
jgi:hypothetical protein